MADVNANIGVNIDTSAALTQLKALQRQISQFHSSISRSSESAALAQRSLQKNLLGSINSIGAFSAELRTVRTSAESFTNSLEKNKFSMREYFRYAGASTKTFGRLFKSEFDTIGKVAQERVKTLQTQYIKMGRNASGAMEAIAVRPTSLNMQDYGTKTAIAAQKQALFNQLMNQGSTNLLNFGKNTQWAGRQLMVGFTIPLAMVGSAATKTFMDMETQALKFRKVYGDLFTPQEETKAALENITELGKSFTKYGVAVSTTVGLAAEAAAAGFSGLDLQRQTEQATRLSILGQVDSQKALETTISLQNAFGMSSENLADSINFLNAVENQTVVSLDDITTAIPKVAPVIQQLGGDVKDLAFLITAMKEGGINASEGANALKSGLASLINPTGRASEMLAAFGINAREIVTSNKGDLKATVIEFAEALNALDPLNRAQAIEQMFGKFQFARLSALFANVTKEGNQASRVLDLANSSVEELSALSEQELGMTADSAMNKFKKSVEDLKFALIPVGQAFLEAATPIIEFVGGVLEKFGNLSDGTKKLITFLTVGIGAIGPIFLMTFGLIANAIANGLKSVLLLRQGYLRLTGQSQILGEQTQYLNTEQLEAAAVAHSLDQSHAKLTQSFTAEAAALQKLIAAYQSATRAGQAFMLNNPGMMMPRRGGRKLASGIVSVPGPKGAGDIVPAMLSPGEAVIPAEFAKKYAPLIQGMVAGNIPGYERGIGSVPGSLFGTEATFSRRSTAGTIEQTINKLDSAVRDLVVNAVPDIVESLKGASISVEGFGKELQKRVKEGSINVPKSAIGGFGEKSYSAPAAIKKQTAAMDWQSRQKEEDAITEALKKYKLTLEQRNNIIGKDTAHIEQSLATGPSGEKIWNPANLQADSRAINKYMEQAKGRMLQFANETDKVDNLVADVAKQLKMSSEAVKARFSRLAGGNQPQTTADYALLSSFAAQDVKNPKNKTPYMAAAAGAVANVRVNDPSYVEALARGDVTAYKKVVEKSTQDIYVSSRKGRQSPHPLAPKDGRDDAEAYNRAKERSLKATRSYESLYGAGAPVTSIDKSIRRQTQKSIKLKDLESSMPMSPQISSGVKATATNMKSMNDRLKSFDRGLMSSSFAISSLAGVASMSGGKLGEMSGTIFKVTTAMFALQAVTNLLTQSGIARFATERGLNAGLLVQNIATRKAGLNTSLFSGGIKQLLPNLLKFGKMIVRFLGPVGLVIGGLITLKGVVDLVNKAREKERLSIEGVGKAANITEGQLKKLGEIYGFVPTQNKFSITPTVGGVVGEQRTKVEETKDLYKSDKEFQNNVKTLRDASVKEADLIFNTMALRLLGAGATQEAIQNIIIALQEEAGRTELKFNFKNIDLNTQEGKNNFKKSIDDVVNTFSKDFAKGVNSKKSLSIASNVLAADLESIKGQLSNATIDAKTFAQSFDLISLKMQEMNKPAALILLNETLKTLNEDLPASVSKLKDINDQMIVLQALAIGLKIEAKQIDALNAGGAAANTEREGILKLITDRINETATAAAAAKEEYKNLNSTTSEKSPKQAIQERTKALLDQAKAYTILRKKGYDASTAAELAGDSLIAAAIASGKVKVGTKEWQNLIDKLKDAQLQADTVSARLTLEQQSQDIKVQLDAYSKLIKAGFDAKKAAELVDNVNLAKLILNTKKAKMTFDELVKAINNAQLQADKLKNLSDPIGGPTVSLIQSSMDKFNSNHELMMEKFRIQEERAKQQFQPAIDAAEKAVQAIQDNIDATNSKFGKLLEPLETESKVLSNSLSIIDNKSKEINDNYDIQQKALQEISDINQEIAAQEKRRITLADALTQGDISAAAVAAQEIRSSATQNSINQKNSILDAARKSELESIKVNGMTRLDIEKRQYEISQLQYSIEQQRDTLLKVYNTQLETANISLKNAQSALSVALKTISDQKTAWENAKLAIDEAENSVRTMNIKLADQLKLVQEITAAWSAAAAAQAAPPMTTGSASDSSNTTNNAGNNNSNGNTSGSSGSTSNDSTNKPGDSAESTFTGTTSTSKKVTDTSVFGKSPVTTTTSIPSVGMNLGVNKQITSLVTTVTKPATAAVKAVSTGITAATKAVAKGVSNLASGVKNLVTKPVSTVTNAMSKIFKGFGFSAGGIVPPKYFASGGFARGTDTVPAMLSPGEFVVSKYGVENFGIDKLKSINNGTYGQSSVYNYSLTVNAKSDANPNDIARTIMTQIKQVDSQRIKTQKGF
jgi:TP901 family phage tail tape measure protein